VTIDTPKYLNYLMSKFLASGGTIVRGTVQHIQQIVEGGTAPVTGSVLPNPPDAIIVCTGLGTRSLGGVEDKTMYPLRGQTVLLRAPWVRFGKTISTKEGLWTYIIPRQSGDVRETF
jgi:D-amino-acid oxidase